MAEIQITKKQISGIGAVDFSNIPFGKVFADHLFIVDYEDGKWCNARIQPYGPLSLSPSLSCMHYGQAIFEGMKAQKSPNGEILLYRPEENWKRLNRSAQRMCMPELPLEYFREGLKKLLELDADWVPADPEGALYIRPFMIGTDDYLGVKPSSRYSFMIYSCPVGAYYSEPLRIRVETKFVRAAKGGVGAAKAAGNYAAAMYPASLAQEKGYHQLLWTDALEHRYIEELGTSNFFALIGNELITPALDGTILEGITRESIIELARAKGIAVQERPLEVAELLKAAEQSQLKEAFATGTAATIAPIALITIGDKDIELPTGEGTRSHELGNLLKKIKTGAMSDDFGWTIEAGSWN